MYTLSDIERITCRFLLEGNPEHYIKRTETVTRMKWTSEVYVRTEFGVTI